jgi:hypothetical protein
MARGWAARREVGARPGADSWREQPFSLAIFCVQKWRSGMSSGGSGRIIANRPRVLPGVPHSAYSPDAGSHLTRDLRPTETLCPQGDDQVAVEYYLGAPYRLACLGTAFPCPLQSGPDSLRNPDPLLFRDPSRNGDHKFAGRACSAEMWLCDADQPDAVRCQLLDVSECLSHALTAEAIQGPHNHHV